MTQTGMALLFGTHRDGLVPNLGASGAIAAVLGAYFILYPSSPVLTLVFIWPIQIPASFFLGAWFLYQLVQANFGLFAAKANGRGVAFFAHAGGFVFGFLVTLALTKAGRIRPQSTAGLLGAPA